MTARTEDVWMAVVECGDASLDVIGPMEPTPESTKAMKTDSNYISFNQVLSTFFYLDPSTSLNTLNSTLFQIQKDLPFAFGIPRNIGKTSFTSPTLAVFYVACTNSTVGPQEFPVSHEPEETQQEGDLLTCKCPNHRRILSDTAGLHGR